MDKDLKSANEYDFINDSLTLKVQSDPKYLKYISWLKENGAIFDLLNFPIAFGRFGYLGITAKYDLPNKKAIMFIPNKLIISTHLVKKTKLSKIIDNYPEIFDEEKSEDADFNILSFFILWEKFKGEESFYHPMFAVSENNYSLLSWSDNELDDLEDLSVKEQILEFQLDMDENWLKVKEIIRKHKELFNIIDKTEEKQEENGKNNENNDMVNTKLNEMKLNYYWAYEFVMTRCYGWSLPSTILIPLADFLNHEKHGVDHYLIHEKYELNEEDKHPEYNIKKYKINLTELKSLKKSLKEEEIQKLENFVDNKQMYIENNLSDLEKNEQENYLQQRSNLNSDQLRNFINKINLNKIISDKNKQIYHFQFFETSDEEDNDTDEDENEHEHDESPTYDLCKFVNKNYDEINDNKDNVEDEIKIIKNQENIRTIKNQKYYEEKLNDSEDNDLNNESDSELDDEKDWSWYDPYDENIYFIVSTCTQVKKDEQIFNCYGRRNNRFLLMWYGFSLRKNAYDSIPIRFLLQQKASDFLQNIEKNIIQKHISIDDFNQGFFKDNQGVTPLTSISKEIRIKQTKMCEDLIIFLRYEVMQIANNLHFPENDKESNYFLNPASLTQEELIFEYAIKVLKNLRGKFLSSSEEDNKVILCEKDSPKRYFTAIFRKSNKEIIDNQIKLSELIQFILSKMRAGFSFKECYMQRHPKFDINEEDFMQNRLKIIWYLRKLYLGVYLKIGQNIKT